MTKISSFARALYSLAEEQNSVKQIYDEVQFLLDYINTDPWVIKLLDNQAMNKAEKIDVLQTAFKPHFSQLLCDFLHVVFDMHEFHQIKRMLKKYLSTVEQIEHTRFIRITSAYPLSEEEISRIKKILEAKIKMQLIVRNHVDPNVIAGFKIESEMRSFDWTIQGKLKAIEASLRATRINK